MIKSLFILLGTISLITAIIGVVVPGLPTTPFLILTTGFYLKGSKKLYNLVISNRFLGHYIKNFEKNRGLTIKNKIYSISLMWLMIFCSIYFFIKIYHIAVILISLGVVGTVVMGFLLKTC